VENDAPWITAVFESARTECGAHRLWPLRIEAAIFLPSGSQLPMDLQELREARVRVPFQPFSMRLTDGRMLSVKRPDAVGVGLKFAIVAAKNDKFVFLEPNMIESLVYRTNGKRGKNVGQNPRCISQGML